MNTNTTYEVKWVNSAYLRDCCGGAMVCGNNFSNKLSFISSMKDCSEILDAMSASKAERIIFMDNSLKTKLTAEEVQAILDHEIGHIVCGHLTKHGYDIGQELEADSYSASKNGNKVMANALRKIAGRYDTDANIRIAALGGADPLPMETSTKIIIGVVAAAALGYIIKKAMD